MRPSFSGFEDTIAALATPAGRSAIAVVRLSGGKTRTILSAVAPALKEPVKPRHPRLVSLVDRAGETIDQGLVTYFAAPASYTGEDVAELSVHGSPAVVKRLLAALTEAGARLARPGEFTERAFCLGKVDLVRAEAVRDLIEARTEAAARICARRLEGRLSARLAAAREGLLEAAAQLTATIDFAEDVGETVSPATRERIRSAVEELSALLATYETGRLLSAGCRVVVLGRPNVGKSTLFNALVGSARAIVTEIPGTTRDTLHATIDVRGIPVELVDTAGLRETEDVVESIGVARARQEAERADAILYVCEASAGQTVEDRAALAAVNGKPVMLVANKIDQLNGEGYQGLGGNALALCGVAPEAGGKLQSLLEETLGARIETETTSEVLGSLRQRDLVERARGSAAQAIVALSRGDSPEYAATHVHDAIDALADLVGETTAEDVLERIFSTFCIGK